jgi:outer membrane immunogenic protein
MKRFLLGLAFASLFAGSSLAADMAARMPMKAPPLVSPAINWSGFYIGAMGGFAHEDATTVNGVDLSLQGGFAGGTLGYNWQFGQWVVGLEADAAWADIKESATALGIALDVRVRSWGTARGRVGMAFDTVLLYATGGYAWMDNSIDIAIPALLLSVSDSNVHHGWTVGAGIEWMFAPKWSFKAEYLYRDFGSENYFNTALPPGFASGSIAFHSGQVGVNYHF